MPKYNKNQIRVGEMNESQKRINAIYLQNCSAQVAYEWLHENYRNNDPLCDVVFNANQTLEYLLFRRNDEMINLGLAQYATSSRVIKRLFNSSSVGVRCALLKSKTFGWAAMKYLSYVPKLRMVELEAFVHNEFLSDVILEWMLGRANIFSFLSDFQYRLVLRWLGLNRRLSTPYNEHYCDGWSDYSYNKVFKCAWELAETLDVSQENAEALYCLLTNAVEPSNAFVDIGEVLSRWRIDELLVPPREPIYTYSYLLRTRIADLLTVCKELQLSDDLAVRESFYRRFSIDSNLRDYVAQDGEIAYFAMLKNTHFWRNAENREILRCLGWEVSDPRSHMTAPNQFLYELDLRQKECPDWFIDEGLKDTSSCMHILVRIEKGLAELVSCANPEDTANDCYSDDRIFNQRLDTLTQSIDELKYSCECAFEELKRSANGHGVDITEKLNAINEHYISLELFCRSAYNLSTGSSRDFCMDELSNLNKKVVLLESSTNKQLQSDCSNCIDSEFTEIKTAVKRIGDSIVGIKSCVDSILSEMELRQKASTPPLWYWVVVIIFLVLLFFKAYAYSS